MRKLKATSVQLILMALVTWNYQNAPLKLQLNKISGLFSQENVREEGTLEKGQVTVQSVKEVDEIWGPDVKFTVSWEKVDPVKYHHGLKVKETIRMFSSIEVVATKKETRWHLSHEMSYWFGTRNQIKRRRYYPSNILHGIVFCELTHRLFEFHAEAYGNRYKKYEQALLDAMFSLQCHAS